MTATAGDLMLRAAREGLLLVLILAGPPLLVSVAVGLLVGIAQAATQVSDPAIAFVPKLVAVALTLIAVGPLLGAQLARFAQSLFLAASAFR